jgi:hypothetical protein
MPPSAVHEATARALGARVGAVAGAGRLAGLDGTEADLAAMDFDLYDRQARSVTADVVLWPRASAVVMNRHAWQRLTPGQRAVLTDAARTAVGPAMHRERDFERGAVQSLCDRGFALVRAGAAGVAALRRAVAPVYRKLESDSATRRGLENIRALKATLPAEPAAACGRDQGRPPAPGAAPLVGSWRVRVTRAQMAAAHRLPQEAVDDNWGNYTLVLGGDGNFKLLNDRYPGPVGFGTWSASGDLLTFTPRGTLEQGAGETWRYRWTLFRGSLELRRLTLGPTALTVAPLRRR